MFTTLFWLSYALLWILVVVQGLAFLEIVRQLSQLRQRLPRQGALVVEDAISTGEKLPELIAKASGDLRQAAWQDYLHEEWGLVVFLTIHCLTCKSIAEGLPGFVANLPDNTSALTIVEGAVDEVRNFAAETRLPRELVAIDETGATAKRLGIGWNPAALLVHRGKVGEVAIVNDIDQLDALIHDFVIHERRIKSGTPIG